MKPLTILCAPIDAVGHVNASAGATQHLLKRGHRVVFFTEMNFRGKLAQLGFEEYLYEAKSTVEVENSANGDENPAKTFAELLLELNIIGPSSPIEKLESMFMLILDEHKLTAHDRNLKKAIEDVNPDVIYVDNLVLMPAVYYSRKPWIKNVSLAPLSNAKDNTLPPAYSGLPTESETHLWTEFQKKNETLLFEYGEIFNDFVEQLGYERYPDESLFPETQLCTVHAYPEELNYPQVCSKGWFNLEVFNECPHLKAGNLAELTSTEFVNSTLDGQFSGKFVYLSLGSMGAIDVELMKRLVGVLSHTKHKYIISKGVRHKEFELAPNMWGAEYLPQTKILPLVDLVITHGGNNTVTETFAQGKPMIVLPLFGDQFDNAQRLHETGYGIRLDPYSFTSEEMIDAIDKLLYDDQLHATLCQAAKRIEESHLHEQLCDKIEQLIA